MPDLTVRNARLFLPEGLVRGGLTVEDGVIEQISREKLPEGGQDIDANGNLVIPGVIDAHVHFYDPNFSEREDFESGSRAAAAGGVTSIISMPLDTPMLAPKELEKAIESGEAKSIIDFGLHAGNMEEDSGGYIKPDIKLGVKTFKIFTCHPYGIERSARRELMRRIGKEGGLAFFHAENDDIIQERLKNLKKAGRKDPLAHAESRPNVAEKEAVSEVISDQKDTGCGVHFAHITTRQAGGLIKEAKTESSDITAETCPHFLIFTKKDLEKKGPYLRVNPPPKTKADVAKLWELLSEGIIDMVTTDHAPGTREEKEVGFENIWDAQIGIPGVETLLPLMFSEGVEKGRISLRRLVEALSTAPAKRFGLYPQKGTIEEGTDADLVIIDREKSTRISSDKTHYKVGWTPYEDIEVRGMPVKTISRGEVIAQEGEVLGKTGRGRFLHTSK